MAKRAPSRDQDKYIVRLPDGMRERIKAKAERAGMSMNEAIVWCLESFFPSPQTFESRIQELADMVAMMKEDGRENSVLDALIQQVDQTVRELAEGKLQSPPDFVGTINERLSQWDEARAEEWRDRHESPFEDVGWRGFKRADEEALASKADLDDDNPFDEEQAPKF